MHGDALVESDNTSEIDNPVVTKTRSCRSLNRAGTSLLELGWALTLSLGCGVTTCLQNSFAGQESLERFAIAFERLPKGV